MKNQYCHGNGYKSGGERKIGNYLKERSISFTYERPVALLCDGKTKIWHPDFYLDDYHIFIEYYGMNGNPEKARLNDYKRKVYQKNKLDVLELYPPDFQKNWQDNLDNRIYETLDGRVKDYLSRSCYNPPLPKPRITYNNMHCY